MDRRAESSDRSRAVSMTRDVAIRESAPPIPRPVEHAHSRQPSQPVGAAERHSNDVWISAISRLQAQVSYNTGMLESHRRQLTEIENVVGRLHHDVTNTVAMLNDIRAEVRARPAHPEPARHDARDLDVLAGQLQRLTNRVNEIDGLNLQIDLMKNRMGRLEDGTSFSGPPSAPAPVPGQRPGPPPVRKEGPPFEPAQHQAHPQHQLPPHPPHSQHPPLPPMRTASMASADTTRPPNFPGPPALESQSSHGFRHATEGRGYPSEPAPSLAQPPPGSGPRPGEALPPPSALSGWRPADAYPPHGASPATAPHPGPPGPRVPSAEVDPHGGPPSGWATVNSNPAVKRPPEETRSPYESPLADGSKRPKLAPLMPNMPRSGYGEESHANSQSTYQSGAGTSNPSDSSFQQRSRAPSDGSQAPSQPPGPTPAQQSLQHNFRFVTSSQQADPPEHWRPEAERAPAPGRGGRGRGRGRGGRGRGRGGAATAGIAAAGGGPPGAAQHVHHPHHAHHGPPHHNHQHHHGPPPDHVGGTPEWERPGWDGNHTSPNGHHAAIMPAYSPSLAARGPPVVPAEQTTGSPAEHSSHDHPATPVQSAMGPHDPYGQGPDGNQTSGGKKTRTKPIRNAEGVLIRKDGRPDMRSVSSANNLRKVHAKKEAERMEMGEDDDGTGSATPASAAAGEMDTSEEPADAPERHHEPMGRMFPHGPEAGAHRAAEQFFPRHDGARMKSEHEAEAREERHGAQGAADVEMGEAPHEEQRREQETRGHHQPQHQQYHQQEQERAPQHQQQQQQQYGEDARAGEQAAAADKAAAASS